MSIWRISTYIPEYHIRFLVRILNLKFSLPLLFDCQRDSRVPYSFLNENIKTLISINFSTEIVLPFFNMAINLMWQQLTLKRHFLCGSAFVSQQRARLTTGLFYLYIWKLFSNILLSDEYCCYVRDASQNGLLFKVIVWKGTLTDCLNIGKLTKHTN